MLYQIKYLSVLIFWFSLSLLLLNFASAAYFMLLSLFGLCSAHSFLLTESNLIASDLSCSATPPASSSSFDNYSSFGRLTILCRLHIHCSNTYLQSRLLFYSTRAVLDSSNSHSTIFNHCTYSFLDSITNSQVIETTPTRMDMETEPFLSSLMSIT